ncbi:helix-turn-helix domain-containing protein [Peribacillus alkalitolerans]|uniref:helix-turn-helix domain-containing protein n=1 Tax=Peribacillus alkalitolerans TaxID=1550385 RepID=UPI0013D65738|nr:helix-turn-helix domain-containing protein [Peribacillus alkalitolerans]
MLEGEIIKYYRKKAGLSQEQLGKDICTATHVSKIERGQTKYSAEIITLFSKRLEIDIQKEIESFQNIEQKLHQWHNAIIMQRMKEIEKKKQEIDTFFKKNSSNNHAGLYKLLLSRYYLLHQNSDKALKLINQIENQNLILSPYDKNLHLHVLGLVYLQKCNNFESQNRIKAIETLKRVNDKEYGNEEIYYHLAIGYHWIESTINAYINAEKALEYFKRTNNFSRAIQAESVILVQKESATEADFEEKVERYLQLIDDSQSLGKTEITAMLIHNLGFAYYKRKDYSSAHDYYRQALNMANKQSSIYLNRLFNYLDNCIEGELFTRKKLLKRVSEGFSIARDLDNPLYKHLFKLLILQVEDQIKQYFIYLEDKAFPFLKANNTMTLINKYGRQLYNHYVKTKQFEKAMKIGDIFVNKTTHQ